MHDVIAQNVARPLHCALVSNRRCQHLAAGLSQLIDGNGELVGLDIGCGTGAVAQAVESLHPSIKFQGIDVVVRADALIAVTAYDGVELPFPAKSFDCSMLVDVLHHTDDPVSVLKEAVRVTRRFILVKDHYCENAADRLVLSFMDWFGNKAYSVALPCNYQSRADWRAIFSRCDVHPDRVTERLNLYPFPFSLLFEGRLHFAARLRCA